MRRRFFRKTRSERGAGQCQARNERRTKLLRKKIQQARPIQLTRPGWGEGMRRRVGKPAPFLLIVKELDRVVPGHGFSCRPFWKGGPG